MTNSIAVSAQAIAATTNEFRDEMLNDDLSITVLLPAPGVQERDWARVRAGNGR
jgi:hypothetical protein